MTTTKRRQIFLVLVGVLMLVTRGTDSLAIHSDERVDSVEIESRETLPEQPKVFVNAQVQGQIISRYSDEYDDLSLERVHVGPVSGSPAPATGQLAPIQMTYNGPANQVIGVQQSPNIRNPVLIHSDEHDDTFSIEVSLAGVPTQMASNGGQESSRGKRIFKQPDERHIVSARPGKQVIIRSGATPGSPPQTTSINKVSYRHSDEHDDYSDEVRSIMASPANNAGHQLTNIPPSPDYRLRSDGHGSLPWREGEDDVHVQIDPVTKQVVNIRTELRDSLEHDVDFSDDIIRSRTAALPVNTNAGNVQTPLNVNGRLVSLHSDEFDDRSYEVVREIVNGQNLTTPTQEVRLISRHSDEQDDSLEIVRGIPNDQIPPAPIPSVQTAVNGEHFISRHSDEVDDISVEVIRPGQSPISVIGGVPQVPIGVERLLRHSEEHDSSVEVIGRIGNLPINVPIPTAVQNQGVHLVQTHSDELDDTSLEVRLVRNQTGSDPGVHPIYRHSEKHDDASLEVVRHSLLNPQNGQNPAGSLQGVQLVSRHSDEYDGDTSLEVHLIRNQSGQVRLLKHSDERYDTSLETTGSILNLQNGQITKGVGPVQARELLIKHSAEFGDDSVEIHHTIPSEVHPAPIVIDGTAPAAVPTRIEHFLRHSDEDHDVSLEDVIRRAPSKVGIMQTASVQQQGVLSGDSDEHEDLSLEVDINLLPEIQRLFTNVKTDLGVFVLPEVQSQAAPSPEAVIASRAAATVNQGNPGTVQPPRMSRLLKHNVTQELREILANPKFQQKIQEIDSRLKLAPDSRSKRLIEKYVEALALSSTAPFNSAPTIISSSFYFSILITWVMVWLQY